MPQELDLLSVVLDRADQINFDNKEEYIRALKSIAGAQTTMYTSDIESLGNLFEGMNKSIRWHPTPCKSSLPIGRAQRAHEKRHTKHKILTRSISAP